MQLSHISPDRISDLIPTSIVKPQSAVDHDENDSLDEEDGPEDPKYTVQKTLIRELFTKKSEENAVSHEKLSIKGDTVELSAEALELSRREHGELSIKNGNEQLTLRFEHEERIRIEQVQTQSQDQPAASDPLVIDLDGDGVELTDARNGTVRFDLTADGVRETVSWVGGDDGLLALDRNGNGFINDGSELFGDQHGAADGFAELARFDDDANGVIDSSDSVYSSLRIWRDKNADGISGSDELAGLESYGIQSISVLSDGTRDMVAGNRIQGYSGYTAAGGSGQVAEVWLNIVA